MPASKPRRPSAARQPGIHISIISTRRWGQGVGMRYCRRGAHALFLGSSVTAVMAGMGVPARAQTTMLLDTITVTASKTPEKAIDSLSAISTVGPTEIKQIAP